MKQQTNALIFILILLTGFALRLYRLGGQSLWYDETVSAILARKSTPDLIAHTARDIHPPGYYLLFQLWTRLAGETEFALAFLSLVFGTLLIAGVYLFSRTLFKHKPRIELWAAGLVALSPYNLWYSQEVRMYTLGAFLGLLATYFILKATRMTSQVGLPVLLTPPERVVKKSKREVGWRLSRPPQLPKRGSFGRFRFLNRLKSGQVPPSGGSGGPFTSQTTSYWLGYTLTATLGLYTLYYFAFLLIPLNLFMLATLLKTHREPTQAAKIQITQVLKTWAVCLRPWLLANLAIIILYLPWLGPAWRQATNPPVPTWRSEIPFLTVLLESWTALSFGESVLSEQVWPLLILSLGLFSLGLYACPTTRWRILLPWLIFGPLAIIYFAPIVGLTTGALYHVRYVFTYSPPFYIIVGLALAWLWQKQKLIALLASLLLFVGATFSIRQLHTNPLYASDHLRGAVNLIHQKWRPGDVVLIHAGYTYTAFQYYFSDPVDHYLRLTSFASQIITPDNIRPDSRHPIVLKTGMIDGPPSLGWGDPKADFYTMSQAETIAALEGVSQTYPRLWMLRVYDTVTDREALIRQWLTENMTPFADHSFPGTANIRVQGFLSRGQPPPPHLETFTLENRFKLHGFTPPVPHAKAGQSLDVALWWEAQVAQPTAPPYALSLKLWDSQGNLAAQTEPDEWPIGNLHFTPAWKPGHILRYPMRLSLPSTILPDQYWLNVVFYNSQNGVPLQIQETGETVILLGGVTIVE